MKRFIVTIDNALSRGRCREIIRRFEADGEITDGSTGYGVFPEQKLSSDLDISGRPEWRDVEEELICSARRGLERYSAVNESISSIMRIGCSAFRLRRYDVDQFFNWHVDCFDASVADRILACIWYLNDVKAGGATEFLYQRRRVKPQAGQLLMFPTSFEYVHRSAPAKSGAKYIALCFIEHLKYEPGVS